MSRFLKACSFALGLAILGAAGDLSDAQAQQQAKPAQPKLGIGREATAAEIKGWDIAVRPDGHGMPPGKGTAAKGEEIFQAQCAACHGEFGEGKDRWPVLVGGRGTLNHDRPEKTIGSFYPYASTVFDYIKRAMPFGNAQSLSNDDVYALTAYLLQMNDVIKDPEFELNATTLQAVKMPNADNFYDDDRETAEKHFWNRKPCMMDCKKDSAVLSRARSLDITPDGKSGPKVD